MFAAGRVNVWLADRLGTSCGSLLAVDLSPLTAAASPAVPFESSRPAVLEGPALPIEPASFAVAPKRKRKRAGKGTSTKTAAPRHGVFVPARAVLRLAAARVIPRAVPVGPSGTRPAGLRLVGVGGLGLGMRDGDVLTRVAGASVTSVPAVVRGVIAARAQRAREISAEFWRDGEAWSLVVEQPYVDSSSAGVAPP